MIWAAAAMAALSIAGNLAGNSAAKKSYKNQRKHIQNKYDTEQYQLNQKKEEVVSQARFALSDIAMNKAKEEGAVAVRQAESGVVGATSARVMQSVGVKAELQKDKLVQQADTQLSDIQTQMSQSLYNANASLIGAKTQQNNNTKSGLTIFTEAAGAFMSVYSMGGGGGTAKASSGAASAVPTSASTGQYFSTNATNMAGYGNLSGATMNTNAYGWGQIGRGL